MPTSGTTTLDSRPAPEESPTGAGTGPGEHTSPHAYDAGLLVLRLVLGLTMAAHGAQKLFGWFGGNGLEGTGQFFSSVGYPAGDVMAVVAGLTEGLGGLALALGLLTPLAGAALFGTLLNVLAVQWGGGFFAPKGIEYELLLTAGAAALTLTGPGRYAADRMLPVLRAHRLGYGATALVVGAAAAGVLLLVRG
ncbi:DoxX family protein [Streptomyces sp. HNM0574]|uniref:DoxX family protein n=1 Tax=Streptomyces sp. HNM0574 TaxID=2714954 RepID=UPI00146E0D02|nr:DoxX family protein [Streptomyces sp. HNM0574]NLU69043.1 DoxX family protein [Streptomyces sp. HNM0574]